ncbi:hypothetical protein BT96DRAFT_927148 [Gymnopus androsaceus JB14]|uniref:HD domain-containing protein n=1 Tax=Gymnopus androsaceus JB14 TaxID=1447944 RepID=A0A6A4GSI5_9AGAR|nr:hypothetical protein BT96DRAFT_927148 [Gymnopus androsaceus JB14]
MMAIPQTFDAFVPSNFEKLIAKGNFKPTYVGLEELKAFDTAEFRKSYELAKKLTSESIFNHSLRMYYYSLAILHSGFPSKTPSVPQIAREEVFKRVYLGTVLHDLGLSTNEEVTTHPSHEMTFEFTGGIIAFEHLVQTYGPLLNASEIGDVTQSIMLHTNPFNAGMSSATAMLVQLSAFFDLGGYDAFGRPELLDCMLHADTVKEIQDAIPKEQLAKEFLSGLEVMVKAKPNCIVAHNREALEHSEKLLRKQIVA